MFERAANIVSNRMRFDGDGKLIGFQDKTIHIFNKGAVALKGTPNYEKVPLYEALSY